jgi:hypothetical protein
MNPQPHRNAERLWRLGDRARRSPHISRPDHPTLALSPDLAILLVLEGQANAPVHQKGPAQWD